MREGRRQEEGILFPDGSPARGQPPNEGLLLPDGAKQKAAAFPCVGTATSKGRTRMSLKAP